MGIEEEVEREYQRQMKQLKEPLPETCCIPGCNKPASSWWPLLPNCPCFCSEHYDRATEYGADLTPFDPECPWDT